MTVKCTFCNDTKREPGQPGPCTWCECAPDAQQSLDVQRFTIARLRYAGGEEHNVKYVSEVDYDRVVAERDSLQAQNEASKQRIARLHHVGLELTGVIDEYRAMPCASLQERMFKTADRYRRRLTAKCATCEDWGVIGYTTGQTPETFEQGEYPCPDCTEGKSHE